MKKTMGQIALEAMASDTGLVNPQEIQRAQEKEYIENLIWCAKHARKEVNCSGLDGHDGCKNNLALRGDFFIVALLTKEQLLSNIVRNRFIATTACPTPFHDQSVYKYNDAKGEIEYLWTVPDEQTCLTLAENADIIDPAERKSLQMVLDYYSGKLMRICKKENGEIMTAGGALDESFGSKIIV